MKVCKQTDPEKGLTPVNRNVKDLRMAQMTPIHPTPTGSNHIICRKVRPPLGSWIGKALRPAHCIMCGYLKFDSRWGRWLVVILNLSKSSLF